MPKEQVKKKPRNYWITHGYEGVEILVPMDDQDSYAVLDEDADEVLVRLTDGRELDAEIVGRDRLTDVAILKVDADDLPTIRIADSDNIKVGDIVGGQKGGQPIQARIVEIANDTVKLDFNHPLAGKSLDFQVKVVSVSTAPIN